MNTRIGEVQVKVQARPWYRSVALFIYRSTLGGDEVGKIDSGCIVFKKIKDKSNEIEPAMIVPEEIWQMIVDAAAETTPPIKKEAVDAELKATLYHLEDMRKLVFKDKKGPRTCV